MHLEWIAGARVSTLHTVTGVVWDLNEMRVLVHLTPVARA